MPPCPAGYFSLNVPSGLTLYWFTNNLVTTAQQLYLRRSFTAAQEVVTGGGAGAAGATIDVVAQEPEKKGPTGERGGRQAGRDSEPRRPLWLIALGGCVRLLACSWLGACLGRGGFLLFLWFAALPLPVCCIVS